MNIARFVGGSLREGFCLWADSAAWAIAPAALGITGATLGASRFWSWNYAWQGVTLLILAFAAVIVSGGYSLNKANTDDVNALTLEVEQLRSQLAASTSPGGHTLSNVHVYNTGGDGIRFGQG